MAMGFAGRIIGAVFVPMVFIVDVGVVVDHRFMIVFVVVFLRKVQPDAHAHQAGGQEETSPARLASQRTMPPSCPSSTTPPRPYWYEVNGDACFYHQGDTTALNALLKKFAAKDREVVLHAGPLEMKSLGGEKKVEAQ